MHSADLASAFQFRHSFQCIHCLGPIMSSGCKKDSRAWCRDHTRGLVLPMDHESFLSQSTSPSTSQQAEDTENDSATSVASPALHPRPRFHSPLPVRQAVPASPRGKEMVCSLLTIYLSPEVWNHQKAQLSRPFKESLSQYPRQSLSFTA